MKSNLIKNIALGISLIFAYSCKKGNESIPLNSANIKSLYELITTKNVQTNGNLTIVGNSASFSTELVPNLDITGYFMDKNNQAQKAEKLTVNGFNIEEQSNFRYYKHFSSSTNPKDMDNVASSLFGNDVNIVLNSEKFGNITTSLYSPLYVQLSLTNIKNNEIIKSQGLTIKWNPDSKGVATRGADQPQIGAAVIYHAGFSENQSQTSLPTENVSVFKIANDATGEMTFTPQELAQLPNNGYVIVYTGRANQQIVTSSNGQTLGVTSLAIASSQGLRVQQ